MRACLATLLIIALVACSSSSDYSVAGKQVSSFHSLLNNGNYQAIYQASSQKLKQVDSEQKLDDFLAAVHRKLGTASPGKQVNSGITFGTSGTFVTLIYQTKFSGGDATEKFVYEVDHGRALLAGYNINSDALI